MTFNKTELINFLKKRGGVASYAEIIGAGFNKAHIKISLNSGQIQRVDRGLYSLSDGMSLSNPDLVAVSIKVPKGTVCLLSALAFYEATDEIPKYVDIAIPRGVHANKIKYPPVKFYRFAPSAWKVGIEKHEIEGHEIKVYSLAKTIADCFKFRNKIGVDVARDALKVAITEKDITPKEIMKYAKICRVDNIIKPILEAMI
ncbi:MAG: transcriptional regulator [Candidatus Omnitrophica bacterium]|nr:transcriptional regulator [Candidatus Omnitrophota bacterium]